MQQDLRLVARRVAVHLRNTERAHRSALRTSAELMTNLAAVPDDHRLAPDIGLGALAELAAAQVATIEALRRTVSSHALLHSDHDMLGIKAIGDEDPTPGWKQPNTTGMEPEPLRAVS